MRGRSAGICHRSPPTISSCQAVLRWRGRSVSIEAFFYLDGIDPVALTAAHRKCLNHGGHLSVGQRAARRSQKDGLPSLPWGDICRFKAIDARTALGSGVRRAS